MMPVEPTPGHDDDFDAVALMLALMGLDPAISVQWHPGAVEADGPREARHDDEGTVRQRGEAIWGYRVAPPSIATSAPVM